MTWDDFDIENGVLRFKSSPDYEAPADEGPDNTYDVTVRASDGGQETTDMQMVTIDVTNVDEPGTVTLSTLQPQLGVAIMATLADPDGVTADTISWQWYMGGSPIVGATTATVNAAGVPTSTYAPVGGDVGSVVRATAMYDDGEGADKTAQADAVHAVREAPESNVPPQFPDQDTATADPQKDQEREVAENTPVGTTLGAPIAASDPSDVLTYSLSGTQDDALFSINRATGQLSTKAKLDYEDTTQGGVDHVLDVTVTAADPFGASDSSMVAIMVTDVNEAPTLTAVTTSIDRMETVTTFAVASYTATDDDEADMDDDLEWSLAGADSSKFSINESGATGALTFKVAPAPLPDYESPGDSNRNNVYEVTVVVTDSKGNSDEQDVTVKVTNVEEAGTVTLFPLQPQVDVRVTATLADPDNVTVSSVSWQWYQGTGIQTGSLPTMECAVEISAACFIKGATSATYTPVANDDDKTLNAVASYTDGFGEDVAAGASANMVLADPRNKAPVFPDQDTKVDGRQVDQKRTVLENTPSGMPIGTTANGSVTPDPVTAMDSAGETLTYSLGGPDAASFSIAAANGQLTTKAALDYETKDTYTVTVTAADPLNARSTITVTIKVTNVDEMPELEGAASVKYPENGTGQVATFTAVDPEGKSIVWSLTGDDMDAFDIENGVLRFESSP